jgi:hypothetical protein
MVTDEFKLYKDNEYPVFVFVFVLYTNTNTMNILIPFYVS